MTTGTDTEEHITPDLAQSLINQSFAAKAGQLEIGGIAASDLTARFGSPLFVYDGDVLADRYHALCEAVQGFAEVYYSIKANPNPAIAGVLVSCGAGLEIASGAEFLIARHAGADASRILFAGPGKGKAELELTIAAGIGEIHLESFEEVAAVGAIAARLGRTVPVAIRINPSSAAAGGAMRMGGKPAAFGFDEEIIDDVIQAVACWPALSLTGIHLFAGTQILDAQVLLAQWHYGLTLASNVAKKIGRPLVSIDLGGGLGIPYHDGDGALDVSALAEGVGALRRIVAGDAGLRGARIIIEPGRYLSGPAGVYLMTVRAVKWSRGQRFIITDGGMHHHLAASGNLGQVIKRDYPIVAASRLGDDSKAAATLVGPLCTPLDTLGRRTALPDVSAGDIVAVLQSGAYALSASPVAFLGHPMPAEVMIRNGEATLIRQGGSFEAPLVNVLNACE